MRKKTCNFNELEKASLKSLLEGLKECTELEPWLVYSEANIDRSELLKRMSLYNGAIAGDRLRDAARALKAAGAAAQKLCNLCVGLCREAHDPAIERWQRIRSRVGMAVLRHKRLLKEASDALKPKAIEPDALPTVELSAPKCSDRSEELLAQVHRGHVLVSGDGVEYKVLRVGKRDLRVSSKGEQRTMFMFELADMTLKLIEAPVTAPAPFVHDPKSPLGFFDQLAAWKLANGAK